VSEPREVTAATLHDWSLPEPGSDKEARGRVLVVGGSRSTPGAARLAGESSLRTGAGKLRILTARSVAAALGVAVPEARVTGVEETAGGSLSPDAAEEVLELAGRCDVVLVGPGFVEVDCTVALLERVLPGLTTTVVLDALASAFVTARPERLRELPGTFVLTVNPGELAETLGVPQEDAESDPVGLTGELARRTGATVLCGGTDKVIASGERCWRVHAGGPGLGVSGSGDAQAGIVAGLAARGAEPAQAAVWGGFLHGSAGDLLAERCGEIGFLARQIPAEVPRLLHRLRPTDAVR
jgi:ADP-dependent NAD(P)H-hydrate dehydratase